jgi:hypothetical protein
MIHEGREVKSVLRGCEGVIEGVRRNARLRAWIKKQVDNYFRNNDVRSGRS